MYKEGDLNKEVMINSTTKILLGPSTRKNEKDLETWIKTKGISKESLVERRFAAYATLLKEIWFIPEESKTGEWEQVPATFSDAVEFDTDACTEKDLKQIEEIKIETSHKLIADIPMIEKSSMVFEHNINATNGFYNNLTCLMKIKSG